MSNSRSPSASQLVALVGVMVPACFLDNPAFTTGEADAATSAETTTAAPMTSAAATTASTGTPTTPTTPTTTESTTTESTTTEPTTTAPTGPTTTAPTGPTTTTGGEAVDCWGLDADDWAIEAIEDAELGLNPRSVRISPDGLDLFYTATHETLGRPHRATRATLDDPFLTGQLMAQWPGQTSTSDFTVRLNADEMLFTGSLPPYMTEEDILVSVWDGAAWTPPALLGGPQSSMIADRWSTATEDGSRLVLERNIGPFNPFLNATTWRFMEARRQVDAPAGTPFDDIVPVELPGITDSAYAHGLLCAAIAPGGLHLLFGSSYPDEIDADNVDDALRVQLVERADVDAPWGSPTTIPSLSEDTWQTCPYAITRDGCQMTFARFKYPNDPNESDPLRPFLARRGP